MKQTVSNQMGSGHIAQQNFAASIELMYATQKSLYFYSKGIPLPVILGGQKS